MTNQKWKNFVKKIYIIAALAIAGACFMCGCGTQDAAELGKQLMDGSIGSTSHACDRPLLERAESYDTDGNPLETWEYSYDEKDRISQVIRKQFHSDAGELVLFETDDFEYVKDGTYKETIHYSIESEETHSITYDAKDREIYHITDVNYDGNKTHVEFATQYDKIKDTEVATVKAVDSDYSYVTEKIYNKQGDVISYKLIDPEGTESTYTTEYVYDKQGRMLSQTQSDGAGMRTTETYEYEGRFDKPSCEVKETFLGSEDMEVTVSKQTRTFVYDAQGHMMEERYAYDDAAKQEGTTGRLGKILYFYEE